jgi:hypothetical protein
MSKSTKTRSKSRLAITPGSAPSVQMKEGLRIRKGAALPRGFFIASSTSVTKEASSLLIRTNIETQEMDTTIRKGIEHDGCQAATGHVDLGW